MALVPAGAVDDGGDCRIELVDAPQQRGQRDPPGAGEDATLLLAWVADVDQLHRAVGAVPAGEVSRRDPQCRHGQVGVLGQHPPHVGDGAHNPVEPDAGQAHPGLGSRPGSVTNTIGWSGRAMSPAYSAKRPSIPTLTAPRRCPEANSPGRRASIRTAPSASHRATSSTPRKGGTSESLSRPWSERLAWAAKPKYGGATDWPVVTAAMKSSSAIGWRA